MTPTIEPQSGQGLQRLLIPTCTNKETEERSG